MESVRLETGPSPKVRITVVGGDLRVTGRAGTTAEVQAAPRGDLSARPVPDGLEIACRSACLVFLPPDSQVSVESVGGDARLTGISGELSLGTVGGDLAVRRAGKVSLTRVGGDAALSRLAGDLTAEWIGGDAIVEQVEGSIRLVSLGGDLALECDGREVEASVGGDAKLRLTPVAGGRYLVKAGGDLYCRLPEAASARLVLTAGGDLDIGTRGMTEQEGERVSVRLGQAEAEIELTAGGDLKVSGAGKWAGAEIDLSERIRSQVEAEMEAALAQVEASLDSIGGGDHWIDKDRLTRDIRRATERAQRRAARARQRVEEGMARGQGGGWRSGSLRGGPTDAGPPASSAGPSDEERLAVLRMLEQGTISVADAEKLLQALEGRP